ncbi:hypothetical protein RGQ29_028297 [Quercus rubra]|uniref:Uncharacterized protein n=1 Tax=Quercus rubra TaxID=3512 RepID=A0AAN7ERF6_QUERU|nr:hypothetical protein RGQ29_028297 [Quercus rubra]
MEGFDLFVKWMAKHHPGLDLSSFTVDNVEKELMSNCPSEAIAENVTEEATNVVEGMKKATVITPCTPLSLMSILHFGKSALPHWPKGLGFVVVAQHLVKTTSTPTPTAPTIQDSQLAFSIRPLPSQHSLFQPASPPNSSDKRSSTVSTTPRHLSINFPPVHVSPLLRPQRLKGWGSNGAVFEHLIQKVKPQTIIEVGTFLGASAVHMVGLTRQLGLQTQILCVDDFRGWPGFRDRFKDIKMLNGDVLLLYQFMQNLVSVNATDSVLPVPFSSGSALNLFCEWGVYADLIEVDAGHDFISAWSDINRAYRLLRPGGVIFGHDYFTAADDRGVRRAVNLFCSNSWLQIIIDGQHWVIDST